MKDDDLDSREAEIAPDKNSRLRPFLKLKISQ